MPKKKLTDNSQNNDSPTKSIDELQCFWSSLSMEEKEKYLVIRVHHLRDYLIKNSSPKKDVVIATFGEAIAFGLNQNQRNVCWEFWLCSRCNQSMFTDEESYVQHILNRHVTQVTTLDVALPNDDWINIVSHGTWKPVDVPAALKIIQDSPIDDLENQIWPLCDEDIDRAQLLVRLRKLFKELIDDDCFTKTNLESVKTLVSDELMNIMPETHRNILPMKLKLHDCICFLNVSQLDLLLEFLNVLSSACATLTSLDEDGSLEKSLDALMSRPIQEVITFNEDRSCLLLDKRLLEGNISPLNYLLPQVPSLPTASFHDNGVDAFVKWVFFGNSVTEETLFWKNLKTEKMRLENDFVLAFERTSGDMLSLSVRSMQLLHNECSLKEIEKILVAEDEKREKDAVHQPESYESLLKKWLSNIDRTDNETSPTPEEVLIETILKDAEDLDVNEFGEHTSPSMRNWLSDMKSTDKMRRQEASIRISMKRKMDTDAGERDVTDAMILKIDALENRMVDKFERASALDYRAILLSFIQSLLKDRLIMQAAEKKAKEAADELLAEEDKEKNKSKAKRKRKNKKRDKGDMLPEASSDDLPHEENTEQTPSSILDIGGIDQVKLQEEERKQNAEFEMAEKMLNQKLKSQLKLEEEVKHNNLVKKYVEGK